MKIVSGGQTGVDRAALDAAITMGIPHGGWCPRGRLAEDGSIPEMYRLQQTDSPEYRIRTERNVVDSDATLILCLDRPSGGTELTRRLAQEHGRLCQVVDLNDPLAPDEIADWLHKHDVHVLNVAGPRESQSPGIGTKARRFMLDLLPQIRAE